MGVFQILGSAFCRHRQSAQAEFQILKGLSLIHIRDGHANLFQMIPRAHVNDDTITTAGWWWCTLGEVSCFSDQIFFPKYVNSVSRILPHLCKISKMWAKFYALHSSKNFDLKWS